MQTIRFVYWQEGDEWLGYIEEYPDYWTQGKTLDDLKSHLKDLYQDLAGGSLPGVRRVGELVLPVSTSWGMTPRRRCRWR